MKFLLIAFIVIPIIEIAIFIQAGQALGLGLTLLLIVATAIIGVNLLKQQGLSTLFQAQQKMQVGEIPAKEMIEGIMLAIAGALLITPGFFTDLVGFMLLTPAIRSYLIDSQAKKRFTMHMHQQQYRRTQGNTEGHIIEGEIIKNDPKRDN